MSNFSVPFNPASRAALAMPVALDATGNARVYLAGTATVDDNTVAYLAKLNGTLFLVPIAAALSPGTTKTVTVTINGTDLSGVPLPAVATTFDLLGPALPPPATHFLLPSWSYVNDSTPYPTVNPGTASIPIP